jgi:hypothetical protein
MRRNSQGGLACRSEPDERVSGDLRLPSSGRPRGPNGANEKPLEKSLRTCINPRGLPPTNPLGEVSGRGEMGPRRGSLRRSARTRLRATARIEPKRLLDVTIVAFATVLSGPVLAESVRSV